MKISRTTFGVEAYAESSRFIGDLRDYFAVIAIQVLLLNLSMIV